MTEKRFRVNELVEYNYSEIGEYIDEKHTDRPLRNDVVCELLNELHEENESLKEENKFLRNKVGTYRSGNALLKKTLDEERK